MSSKKKDNIVAIIPARGGSKGIPKKNITPLNGKPLISYTIQQALKTPEINKIIVSTDDPEIKKVSKKYKAQVIDRPTNIAGDTATSESAIEHVLTELQKQKYTPDIIVFLQCTSPIRKNDDISNAINLLKDKNYDSVFSATENYPFIWLDKNGNLEPLNKTYQQKRPMRQDRYPEYIENGSIYVFTKESFDKTKNRTSGKKGIYIMPYEHSFEVDSLFVLWLCEQIIRRNLL